MLHAAQALDRSMFVGNARLCNNIAGLPGASGPRLGRIFQLLGDREVGRLGSVAVSPVYGPIALALDNLSANAVLTNASGVTACASFHAAPRRR